MTWTCPACGSNNEGDIVRCTCGAEDTPPVIKSVTKTEAEIAGEKAQAAKEAGAKFFQIVMPLSTTRGGVVPMMGVFTTSETADHASILEAVEEHGWHLEHVNYVFKMTEIVSRDKLLSSGQQEAVSGEVLGIYIFRMNVQPTPPAQ
ncbi:hypothetical protein [Geobacter sp. DSM 9736]|uniref:hypothetical protein n=1 Tax=Geobacter sp. DSM 9736 TaxID=1277350 RepID=UPI000B500799|nr:hypothetical protein [Geobacter sp. DSM 9736]SNB44932.1 hypothetical protein SAMN06269301_0322 [Geobacter sp. DSM 9736]